MSPDFASQITFPWYNSDDLGIFEDSGIPAWIIEDSEFYKDLEVVSKDIEKYERRITGQSNVSRFSNNIEMYQYLANSSSFTDNSLIDIDALPELNRDACLIFASTIPQIAEYIHHSQEIESALIEDLKDTAISKIRSGLILTHGYTRTDVHNFIVMLEKQCKDMCYRSKICVTGHNT